MKLAGSQGRGEPGIYDEWTKPWRKRSLVPGTWEAQNKSCFYGSHGYYILILIIITYSVGPIKKKKTKFSTSENVNSYSEFIEDCAVGHP